MAGIFGLIVLAAFSGCRTKITQAPSNAVADAGSTGGSTSVWTGSARTTPRSSLPTHPSNEPKGITRPGEPAPSPRAPADSPPPAATPAPALTKVETLPKERPSTLNALPPSPAPATTKPALRAVVPATPPPAELAPVARVSLGVPPVAPTAPRPVARLTLGERPVPTAAPKPTPRPVGLSGLITAAPTTAPARRLTAGIPAPSLTPLPPARLQPQSLDLLTRLASPQITPRSIPDGAQPLRLPVATPAVPTVRFDPTLWVSRPATTPVLWPAKDVPAASVTVLSNWVSAPPPPPPPDSAATREDREILHRKIYRILLGP